MMTLPFGKPFRYASIANWQIVVNWQFIGFLKMVHDAKTCHFERHSTIIIHTANLSDSFVFILVWQSLTMSN
jgi:hypothetical protein